ncbi:MAG: hypothetical protein KKE17_00915 [Proteobacteria bacterium]|nr:hypothetical protein [Pseudomonadota bacterium]MBU1708542.1 hypothetical protein [Pseudomonadota bacterium]
MALTVKQRIKRFIITHILPGIPFMALAVSGGMLFFSRFWNIDSASFMMWVNIHKIASLFWMVLLTAMVIVIGFKFHKAAFQGLFSWGKADLLWFKCSLKSIINPNQLITDNRVYKTRQKVNLLLVIGGCLGFVISGFAMWFWASILIFWYVHVVFFFMTMSMVIGHLFITFKYPISKKQPIGAYLKVELFCFFVTVFIGVGGFFFFNQGQKASQGKAFVNFIRPLELSKGHRIKELVGDCSKCHDYTGSLKDERCLECHKIIKARRDTKSGYHGLFEGNCRNCHKEHPGLSASIIPFNPLKFNHALAAYKLVDKHADPKVKCDACHKRKGKTNRGGVYYLGFDYAFCTDCHEDPHYKNEFGNVCDTCHNIKTWKGGDVRFDHDRDSKYPLKGGHVKTSKDVEVKCADCHKPLKKGDPLSKAKLRGLSYACISCHKDFHKGGLGDLCENCHTMHSWKGKDGKINFDHNRDSRYSLKGKHETVKCELCHQPKKSDGSQGDAIYRGLSRDCVSCHKDIHNKELGKYCENCHNDSSWVGKDVTFNHDTDSKYRLKDKHAKVKCVECHKPAPGKNLGTVKFIGIGTECIACHEDPHKSTLDKKCEKCHSIKSWVGEEVRFDHDTDSRYPLTGEHIKVKCIVCHKPEKEGDPLGKAKFVGFKTEDCDDCHKDPHKPEDEYGKDCLLCHSTGPWPPKKPDFSHQKHAKYPLTGLHEKVKCLECHNKKSVRSIGPKTLEVFLKSCLVCHKDPHTGQIGTDCDKCHSTSGWKGKSLLFDHNKHSVYKIDKIHIRTACKKCHDKGLYKPIRHENCADCHDEYGR